MRTVQFVLMKRARQRAYGMGAWICREELRFTKENTGSWSKEELSVCKRMQEKLTNRS